MEALTRRQQNDESDWTISVAAASCLTLMSRILKVKMLCPAYSFIEQNINSKEWNHRQAALLALASILKGPPQEDLNKLVTTAMPTLFSILRDPIQQVRWTAAWTFAQISSHFEEILRNHEILTCFLKALIGSISDKPKISAQICNALSNLAECLKPSEVNNSCPLSPYFKEIVGAIWNNAYREDGEEEGMNLRACSFAVLADVIEHSAPDILPHLSPVVTKIVEEFGKTLKNSRKEMELQQYLCLALLPLLSRMTGKISQDQAGRIVGLIIESFKIRKGVYDEGFLALSGLAIAMGKDFTLYMEPICPYLLYALKAVDDPISRIAVSFLGDLAQSIEDDLGKFLEQLMPILMGILKSPEVDRYLKLKILSTIGFIAYSTKNQFFPYLKDVLNMLKSAASLSLTSVPEVYILCVTC